MRIDGISAEIRYETSDHRLRARATEVVVGFVEQNLVRQSGFAPERHELRQQRAHVLDLFAVRYFREIDDRADVRMPQRPRQLASVRRRIVAGERDDARQRLERSIVAFGIDDADAIALQNELFAQQPGEPRLAGARLAGDENRSSANRQADGFAVLLAPEHEPAPPHLGGG
jgi:hypothetical protein